MPWDLVWPLLKIHVRLKPLSCHPGLQNGHLVLLPRDPQKGEGSVLLTFYPCSLSKLLLCIHCHACLWLSFSFLQWEFWRLWGQSLQVLLSPVASIRGSLLSERHLSFYSSVFCEVAVKIRYWSRIWVWSRLGVYTPEPNSLFAALK